MPNQPSISGIILAGGQGRRMGYVDKGLQIYQGQALISHVIARFAPQVDELLINTNQNLMEYSRFSYPVISDEITGFVGPLAGLHIGLQRAQHSLIATVPCDTPYLPQDLFSNLLQALLKNEADLAVATTGSQLQPTFSLYRHSVLCSLTEYLQKGGRKIQSWQQSLTVVSVNFIETAYFYNINTLEELNHSPPNL
jgi:molybdopterin-guanine dinucleotide biosynthesis protein A